MIAKHDEEKRSRIWQIIMWVSTGLIILIVAFFLIKLFTANPLEGSWQRQDSGMFFTIAKDGEAYVQWPDLFEGTDIAVPVKYTIDKDTKTFTLSYDMDQIREAVEEYGEEISIEKLEADVQTLTATYSYNVERNVLTLTDREYGEEMAFNRQ